MLDAGKRVIKNQPMANNQMDRPCTIPSEFLRGRLRFFTKHNNPAMKINAPDITPGSVNLKNLSPYSICKLKGNNISLMYSLTAKKKPGNLSDRYETLDKTTGSDFKTTKRIKIYMAV